MMVARTDLDALLEPRASWRNFPRTASVVGRYFLDRLRFPRGTHLVMGNALAARLFYSLRKRRVETRFEAPLAELVVKDGSVLLQ
jgi:3-oxosteroid 1-dehydrogenase